jgi:hypothetical protein
MIFETEGVHYFIYASRVYIHGHNKNYIFRKTKISYNNLEWREYYNQVSKSRLVNHRNCFPMEGEGLYDFMGMYSD